MSKILASSVERAKLTRESQVERFGPDSTWAPLVQGGVGDGTWVVVLAQPKPGEVPMQSAITVAEVLATFPLCDSVTLILDVYLGRDGIERPRERWLRGDVDAVEALLVAHVPRGEPATVRVLPYRCAPDVEWLDEPALVGATLTEQPIESLWPEAERRARAMFGDAPDLADVERELLGVLTDAGHVAVVTS